jgi:NADH-quinone oxidoreductase subunit H
MTIAAVTAWFAACGLPAWLAATTAYVLVVVLPIVAVVVPVAGLLTIAERKIAAAMQRRVGPNYTSAAGILELLLCFLPRPARQAAAQRLAHAPVLGWVLEKLRRAGLVQFLADGVKTIAKEDLVPAAADGVVFRAAPYLAMAGSFMAFAVIPIAAQVCMLDLSVGVVYVSGVTGLVVVGLLMAGWGSNNKWSLLGGMRAVAQIVSYEIPVVLAMATVVLWAGSMRMTDIVTHQGGYGVATFLGWNLLAHPFLAVAGVIFLIGSLAECNRTPFDLAEAESELVSGFNTEYSGMRWALFALAEYIDMILAGALFAVLFLGGYQSPIGDAWIAGLPVLAETAIHAAILGLKVLAVVGLFIWVRWTLPRFRIDQVMRLAWTRLVPIMLVCVAGTAVVITLTGGQAAYGPLAQVATWAVVGIPGLIVYVILRQRSVAAEHPALRRLAGRA